MYVDAHRVVASTPAVTLAEASAYLNRREGEDATLITDLIQQATEWVEDHTGWALLGMEYHLGLSCEICDPGPCVCRPRIRPNEVVDLPWACDQIAFDPVLPDGIELVNGDQLCCECDVQYEGAVTLSRSGTYYPQVFKTAVLRHVNELYENRIETVVGAAVNQISTVPQSLLFKSRVTA